MSDTIKTLLESRDKIQKSIDYTDKQIAESLTPYVKLFNDLLSLSNDQYKKSRYFIHGNFDYTTNGWFVFKQEAHASCCADDYYYLPSSFIFEYDKWIEDLASLEEREKIRKLKEEEEVKAKALEKKKKLYQELKKEFEG